MRHTILSAFERLPQCISFLICGLSGYPDSHCQAAPLLIISQLLKKSSKGATI